MWAAMIGRAAASCSRSSLLWARGRRTSSIIDSIARCRSSSMATYVLSKACPPSARTESRWRVEKSRRSREPASSEGLISWSEASVRIAAIICVWSVSMRRAKPLTSSLGPLTYAIFAKLSTTSFAMRNRPTVRPSLMKMLPRVICLDAVAVTVRSISSGSWTVTGAGAPAWLTTGCVSATTLDGPLSSARRASAARDWKWHAPRTGREVASAATMRRLIVPSDGWRVASGRVRRYDDAEAGVSLGAGVRELRRDRPKILARRALGVNLSAAMGYISARLRRQKNRYALPLVCVYLAWIGSSNMTDAKIDFDVAGGVDLNRLERSLGLHGERVADGRYR